ncbi:MAG: hypothetical protein LBP69_06235, partial [Treponema sp.]|nr:hypothetical protein [Treponema sp.]
HPTAFAIHTNLLVSTYMPRPPAVFYAPTGRFVRKNDPAFTLSATNGRATPAGTDKRVRGTSGADDPFRQENV